MPSVCCSKSKGPKIAIINRMMIIGGAQRLLIDCASVLADNGYDVSIYTSYYDRHNCFEDTKSGKYAVVETGRFLPLTLFGRFVDFFAHLKSLVLTIKALRDGFDVLLCDDNPLPILFAKAVRPDLRYLFYCHFPEYQFPGRKSLIMRGYRFFFDYVERKGLAVADKVFVNSKFTLQAFKKSFVSISAEPEVLYPTTLLHKNGPNSDSLTDKDKRDRDQVREYLEANKETKIITSINRFDPMKNLDLAIETLRELLKTPQFTGRVKLLLAGSYFSHLNENVECMSKLKSIALNSGLVISEWPVLDGQVVLLCNFSESLKPFIFEISRCVIYTSVDEHFGIVPVEAMLSKLPVIAANSGGPMESILQGRTGFLCQPNAAAFSEAAAQILLSEEKQRLMGENGHKHVVENFSLQTFEKKLVGAVNKLHKERAFEKDSRKVKCRCSKSYLFGAFFFALFIILFVSHL